MSPQTYGAAIPADDVVEKRTQLLLTELLGETVKIRNRGYKTMRQARVDAIEHREWMSKDGKRELIFTGEFKPKIVWKGEARASQVWMFPRLDVMTPRGWATVWDDGKADLSPFDQKLATSAAPTNLKYRSGML